MKQALIDPRVQVYKYDSTFLGNRVCEVADQSFEVASPLFWTACPDEAAADEFYYDPNSQEVSLIPIIEPGSLGTQEAPQVI